MLTRKATSQAVSDLAHVRSTLSTLKAQESALTATLRPALAHWGPMPADTGRTFYVTAPSERRTLDTDAALRLLRVLGASDSDIGDLYRVTTVQPSVRDKA